MDRGQYLLLLTEKMSCEDPDSYKERSLGKLKVHKVLTPCQGVPARFKTQGDYNPGWLRETQKAASPRQQFSILS